MTDIFLSDFLVSRLIYFVLRSVENVLFSVKSNLSVWNIHEIFVVWETFVSSSTYLFFLEKHSWSLFRTCIHPQRRLRKHSCICDAFSHSQKTHIIKKHCYIFETLISILNLYRLWVIFPLKTHVNLRGNRIAVENSYNAETLLHSWFFVHLWNSYRFRIHSYFYSKLVHLPIICIFTNYPFIGTLKPAFQGIEPKTCSNLSSRAAFCT